MSSGTGDPRINPRLLIPKISNRYPDRPHHPIHFPPAALAKALTTLAEDPERLEAMRESARENLTRFNLDALDQNLRAVEKKLRPGGEIDLSAARPF